MAGRGPRGGEAQKLYIGRLGLLNFRNYSRVLFCPGEGINFLTGANAQGKSSLLEAVLMVTSGRTRHGIPEDALVKNGAMAAGLKAQINYGGGEDVVEVRLGREIKRIKVNGQEKGRDALPGPAALTVFAPADLSLVQGGAHERRRFIDQEVAVADNSYAGLWRRYQRVLWQKNKAVALGRGSETIVWDEQLASYGAKIVVRRERWLPFFADAARTVYRQVSGGGELTIGLTRPVEAGAAEAEVEKALAEALAKSPAGPTAVGPHRDDLVIEVAGQNSRFASSQGEQRTVVLALKLAGHVLRRRDMGENPLVLLDDAFYELDPGRTQRLLGVLDDGSQVLATANAAPGKGRVFRIEDGHILE